MNTRSRHELDCGYWIDKWRPKTNREALASDLVSRLIPEASLIVVQNLELPWNTTHELRRCVNHDFLKSDFAVPPFILPP
jgi:hypothetical protein